VRLGGLCLQRVRLCPAGRLSAARSTGAAEALLPAGGPADNAHSAGANGGGAPPADAARYPLAVAALRLHAERMQLIAAERRLAQRFTAAHPAVPVARVAALPEDVHDLAALRVIGQNLSDN
jgi:hypothetical protein